jgi:hypothetical protein
VRILLRGRLQVVLPAPGVEGPINDRIDNAYRAQYRESSYLKPMIGASARSETVKVMPRDAGAPLK